MDLTSGEGEMKEKEVEKEKMKRESLTEGEQKIGWLTSTHALELLHSDRSFEFIEGIHRNMFTLQQPDVLIFPFQISIFN